MSPLNQKTSTLRKQALDIFEAGVIAANPYMAVKQFLHIEKGQLKLTLKLDDENFFRSKHWSKIHLIAFGKAACAMAKAALEIIPNNLLADDGIVVSNYNNISPISKVEVMGAGHPLPDESGLLAAKKCADIASHAKQNELVLVLISGGGSALIPYPVNTLSLEDKISTTNLLLACGATIHEINCIRKHLSQLKGGGLAKLSAPADLHAIILSDVLDNDLSVIASGPTVADNTTFNEAINIFNQYGLWDKVPDSVKEHLDQGQKKLTPETPKTTDPIFNNTTHVLIGSNSISLDASAKTATKLGYSTLVYNKQLCGEAKYVAEDWVKYAKSLCTKDFDTPIALLAGGETTVTLKGDGKGGRNQELSLAFAIAAEKYDLNGDWVFLSGGTDGQDGPTDAAGGLIDKNSLKRMIFANHDPERLLNNNDSYTALKSSNDLLMTGATGTNVADLQILLIHPKSDSNTHS